MFFICAEHNFFQKILTVAGHADSDAFLEPAVLAAIAVHPDDVALLILQTRPILDLLLDAPPEKSLRLGQRKICSTHQAIKLESDTFMKLEEKTNSLEGKFDPKIFAPAIPLDQ